MSSRIKISVQEKEKYCFFQIKGEINFKSSIELKEYVLKAIKSGYTNIFIEVSNVRNIDSSGLTFFTNVVKKLKEKNGNLFLIGPSKDLMDLLDIASVNTFMEIYHTLQEAERALGI